MKITIEIPDKFYQTYKKNLETRTSGHSDIELEVAVRQAVYKEINHFAAVYRQDFTVTVEENKTE